MSKGMGGHTSPNEGESKVWLTPPAIIRAIGPFDLDPCAAPSPRPWSTAVRHIELPEDGLAADWRGRVFLNPPYSQEMGPWLEKMGKHGNGIALIFARTETEAWHRHIWPVAHSVFFFEGRLTFHYPSGAKAKSNGGAPSALISYSQRDTDCINSTGMRGILIELWRLRP